MNFPIVRAAWLLVLMAMSAPGEGRAGCDPARCFSKQDAATQKLVLDGEAAVVTAKDPASPFEQIYVLKRVRGADPQLIAGMFASVKDLRTKVDALVEAETLRQSGSSVVVRYTLDPRRLLGPDAGALAAKAPLSRYAVTNHHTKQADGSYFIWWELEASETARLNPRKGLFSSLTANLGEPERVNGFLLVEAVPGTADSVITYASHVVPKAALARAASGVVNQAARRSQLAIVERVAAWAEAVAVGPEAERQRYRKRVCELLLTP